MLVICMGEDFRHVSFNRDADKPPKAYAEAFALLSRAQVGAIYQGDRIGSRCGRGCWRFARGATIRSERRRWVDGDTGGRVEARLRLIRGRISVFW